MTRTFEDVEAKRTSVPLLVGLTGPSGGGKTFSALRLATGIQRVTGGEIFMVDTEAKRGLHYADDFRFRHVPFEAPFGPLDYLAAIEHCVKRGAKVVIVDSMSHEHEGPGGVLEQHAAEVKRLAKAWNCSEKAASMSAWAEPKGQRRRMINTILQLPISSIFCFRAKEKLKIAKGKDPQPMGFMPVAGEEFTFEMTANMLLLPRADGVPTWRSEEIGEQLTMKLPRQFMKLFAERRPLSEDIGEAMARWAAGGSRKTAEEFAAEIAVANGDELKTLGREIAVALRQKTITKDEHARLGEAGKLRRETLASAAAERESERQRAAAAAEETFDPDTGEMLPTDSAA